MTEKSLKGAEDAASDGDLQGRLSRIHSSIGNYYSRIEGNKSFREKEEEKRRHQLRKKKKRSNPRGCPTEFAEHVFFVKVLRSAGVKFIHPNNNARNAVAGRRAKMMGVEEGTADIIIFTTPPKRPWLKGLCVEIKALDGRASKSQVSWLRGMSEAGYGCFVAWGAEAAIEVARIHGYLNRDGDGDGTRRVPSRRVRGVACYEEIHSVEGEE